MSIVSELIVFVINVQEKGLTDFFCAFQVHKKICNIPIPKIFSDRGRLYKAQSCGSIVRDKINQNPSGAVPTLLTIARDGNNNSNGVGKTKGRGKIFNRRMKDEQRSNGLLQPMLGDQQRLLGSSEGDINRNMNLSSTSTSSLLAGVVDGNNNNDATDPVGSAESNRRRIVNKPSDRRKSTGETLERCHGTAGQLELSCKILVNGVGATEDFQDIDGSSSEEQEEMSGNVELVVGVAEDDGGNSSTAFNASNLSHLAAAPPSGLCSS